MESGSGHIFHFLLSGKEIKYLVRNVKDSHNNLMYLYVSVRINLFISVNQRLNKKLLKVQN